MARMERIRIEKSARVQSCYRSTFGSRFKGSPCVCVCPLYGSTPTRPIEIIKRSFGKVGPVRTANFHPQPLSSPCNLSLSLSLLLPPSPSPSVFCTWTLLDQRWTRSTFPFHCVAHKSCNSYNNVVSESEWWLYREIGEEKVAEEWRWYCYWKSVLNLSPITWI